MGYGKYIIGILTIVISATLLTVMFENELKIDITKTYSKFYVNESGEWILTGSEYNKVYDFYGKKLSTTASKTVLSSKIEGTKVTYTRKATYNDGTILTDVYEFDGAINDKELFPVSHEVSVENSSGGYYIYEVRDLYQLGPDNGNILDQSYSFGKKMVVEWQPGFNKASLKDGVLTINYTINGNLTKNGKQTYKVRLFDPSDSGGTITTNATHTFHTFKSNGTYSVSTAKNITILMCGGGGGGGSNGGGGGGAGGLIYNTSFPVHVGDYAITIGIGSPGGVGATPASAANGSDTRFGTNLTGVGGGGGPANDIDGFVGGSGSGGGGGGGAAELGGAGIAGQGNEGGDGNSQAPGFPSGGGGGAGGAGGDASGNNGGNGGIGREINANGTLANYSCGGGGISDTATSGLGGCSNAGSGTTNGRGTDAVNHTCSGGGAGDFNNFDGGHGGAGILIISYLTPPSEPPTYNISFVSPTPQGGIFNLSTGSTVIINTTGINITGAINTTHQVHRNDGSYYSYNSYATLNATTTLVGVPPGTYFFNVTLKNATERTTTSTRNFTVINDLTANISYREPTPNATSYDKLVTVRINTTSANLTGAANTSHHIYNSTGGFYAYFSYSSLNGTTNLSNLATGVYYFNATVRNSTTSFFASTRNFTISDDLMISFDGNTNATLLYEHGTTILYIANLTSINNISIVGERIKLNLSVIGLSANTSYVVNITVDEVFEDYINRSLSKSLILGNNISVSWIYPGWYIPENLSFNVTGTNGFNLVDVKVLINNSIVKVLYGTLNATVLETYNFSTSQNSSVVIGSPSDIGIISLKIPTSLFLNLTVNISGTTGNSEPVNRTIWRFINTTEIEIASGKGNLTGMSPFVIDDLTTNRGFWNNTGSLTTNVFNDSNNTYQMIDEIVCAPCTGTSSASRSGYASWTEKSINDYDIIGFNYTCTIETSQVRTSGSSDRHAGATCNFYAGTLADGTGTNTLLVGNTCSSDGSGTGAGGPDCSNVSKNIWIIRNTANGNEWNITNGSTPALSTLVRKVNLTSGDLYFLMYGSVDYSFNTVSGSANIRSYVANYVSGIMLGGVGGISPDNGTYGTNFSVTSVALSNNSADISGATLFAKEYIGGTNSSYDIDYWLSADNGTTWESTTNGAFHDFSTAGKVLRWKVNGTSTLTTSNFGVSTVRIQVLAQSPENISLDLGNDGTFEFNQSGVFNSSVLPTILDTSNSVRSYIQSNCANVDICIVPIAVRSNTSGQIDFSKLITRSLVNPVITNATNTVGNLYLYTAGNSFVNYTVSDWRFGFIGDLDNVTIKTTGYSTTGSVLNRVNRIDVRYSPFNLTSVKPFFNFFPTNRFSSNVSPSGQTVNLSYWNVTSLTNNHTMNIYTSLDRNISLCTAMWIGNATGTKTYNITGGNTVKILDLGSFTRGNVWNYLDFFNCTKGQPVEQVYNSLCVSCVQTRDYDSKDVI